MPKDVQSVKTLKKSRAVENILELIDQKKEIPSPNIHLSIGGHPCDECHYEDPEWEKKALYALEALKDYLSDLIWKVYRRSHHNGYMFRMFTETKYNNGMLIEEMLGYWKDREFVEKMDKSHRMRYLR